MRTPLLIFVSMMLCGAVHADTIDVPEDYPTIQDAIGAASNGDTIAIAAGTYFEHDVNAYGKELIITGAIKENGTPATTIDAQQQGRVLVAWGAEVSSTSFQNLILTGGFSKLGGGMHNYYSSPSVINCVFTGNVSTDNGGGMYTHGGTPLIDDCVFTDNQAANGAAIYNFDAAPTFRYCTISNNTATERGAGIYNNVASPALLYCSLLSNIGALEGGGMYNQDSNTTLQHCQLRDNHALYSGGGLLSEQGELLLSECVIEDNGVSTHGGGLCIRSGSATLGNCDFRNNTAAAFDADSRGAAVHCDSSTLTITSCLFTGNMAVISGGALKTSKCSPDISQSHFCNNSPDDIDGDWTDSGDNDFCTGCDGDITGDGLVDVDDLLTVITGWGNPYGVDDLLIVIAAWGECQ